MEFELIPLFSTLLPLIASAIGFLGISRSIFSDDSKLQLALFLENYSPIDFAKQTKRIFDTVFGSKIFSTRSFTLSCVTSFITVGLAFLVVFGLGNEHISSELFFRLAAVIIVLNFVPDFFSLCQTRYILGRMVTSNSAGFQVLMTLADIILSAIIISLYLGAYFYLFHEHVRILITPLGADVLQVVVLSTMIFSILNLVFSIAIFFIAMTPKDLIYNLVDKPLILLGTYAAGAIVGLSVLPVAAIYAYNFLGVNDWLVLRFPQVLEIDHSEIPPATEVLSVMIAFLFLIYLSISALSQSVQAHRSNTRDSKIFHFQLLFTFIVFFAILLKIAYPTLLNGFDYSPFVKDVVESYLVPQGIPRWQVASLLNGVIVLSLAWYISKSSFDSEASKRWMVNLRDWCVRSVRIFSAFLSAYTVCVLVYVTASIQWELLPICDSWTPWQASDSDCRPTETSEIDSI